MSYRNPSSPHRKKVSKSHPVTVPNASNESKKSSNPFATDNASRTRKEENSEISKASENNSVVKSSTSRKSHRTVVDVETSTSNADKFRNSRSPSVENRVSQTSCQRKFGRTKSENEDIKVLEQELSVVKRQVGRMQAIVCRTEERVRVKDQQIDRLKGKVKEWEAKWRNQDSVYKKKLLRQEKQAENSDYLKKKCLGLEQKIHEMEKFIADYGLVWMGEGVNHNSNKSRGSPNTRNVPSKDYLKRYFPRILANVEHLNISVGKDEVHVHRDERGTGASFKTSPPVCLKFFKNGLIVQNGRIRRYEDPAVASFVRDILDGYFPSELQQRYPNGVPFKVEDHRNVDYRGSGLGFPGHGHRLGKPHLWNEKRPNSWTSDSPQWNKMPRRRDDFSYESTTPVIPLNSRGNKLQISPSDEIDETPIDVTDLTEMRSQILASHNNNCSESHLQSHLNAELALIGCGKDKSREVATKIMECNIPTKERDLRTRSQRFQTPRRTSCHSSTDRSTTGMPFSRREDFGEGLKSRLRSSSLPGRYFKPRSLSKLRISPGNSAPTTSRTFDTVDSSTVCKKPRTTRSANLERSNIHNTSPVVKEVNQRTGRPNELRIKLRSIDGSKFYLVHLSADDAVAKLYRLLDTCIIRTRSRRYKVVVSGYAPRRLEHLELSLRECGITRDCVMHVVNE